MFPKETTFYDYDLLSQKMGRFTELFYRQNEKDDEFVYIRNHEENLRVFESGIEIATKKNFKERYDTSCIVWKFEKELHGHYSMQELCGIIPGGKIVDFLCNFVGNENCTLAMNNISIPFTELPFTFTEPFIRPAYQINDKIFHLERNVSFYAGIITNDEVRKKVQYEISYCWGHKNPSRYEILFSRGLYCTNINIDYAEKKLKEEQKKFIKSLTLKT